MKKADSFSGIPAVPSSLAGQWLAFNHMANHYRKLLNVKPRVDTSAPRKASNNNLGKVSSLASFLKQESPSPPKKLTQGAKKSENSKKSPLTKSQVVTCIQEYPASTGDTDSITFDSVSRIRTPTANKKRLTNKKSIKTTPYLSNAPSEYQVVFGPSSIKSSSDALGSDCESQPEQPKVELMGVAEKIRVFLDQLHHNDTRLLSPSKKVTKKKVVKNKENKKLMREIDAGESKSINATSIMSHNNNNRPLRQSKSLAVPLPLETSVPTTPKKAAGNKKKSCVSNTSAAMQYNSSNSPNQKKSLAKAINSTKSRVENSTLSRSNRNSMVTEGESRGMKSILIKSSHKQRNLRGGSIGSVGTIRGSDDLTTDDMLIVPESNQLDDEVMNEYFRRTSRSSAIHRPKIVKNSQSKSHPTKSNKSSVVIKSGNNAKQRGSSAGYCSQSLSGKATSLSSLGIINHNDSSRDSAYGFSSGESRVPSTRESTPEKVRSSKPSSSSGKSRSKSGNKLKTPLSTIASSVNLDCISNRPTGDSHKSFTSRRRNPELRRDEKTNDDDDNEDNYLNFLSEVTQDIVNRGVYTNKGLKILFQAHISSHLDLEYDKMNEMLEQLRTDLGIPKDDVMNRMEFGYGSVVSSTKFPPYTTTESGNYENESDCDLEQGLNHPSISLPMESKQEKLMIKERDEGIEDPPNHTNNHPSRPPTTIDAVKTKESKFIPMKVANIPSEDSLSETDIRLNLKEVGIDSETTLEIVQTIQKSRRRNDHHNDARTSEDSSDDLPTRLINKSNKNSPVSEEEAELHREKGDSSPRSTSSPSSSTESS